MEDKKEPTAVEEDSHNMNTTRLEREEEGEPLGGQAGWRDGWADAWSG